MINLVISNTCESIKWKTRKESEKSLWNQFAFLFSFFFFFKLDLNQLRIMINMSGSIFIECSSNDLFWYIIAFNFLKHWTKFVDFPFKSHQKWMVVRLFRFFFKRQYFKILFPRIRIYSVWYLISKTFFHWKLFPIQ